ncbi:MAG TPA: 3-oxoacyl-[acyl-carrier-protein] synthase III C-terminal domain-containing protein [Solirubrobacterales bacterium]|nr:3-oxoacyl-[acyl-carrier-protein] synthase III C-terminal domain-containing protein [Solirubrobacterales bacterium]
MSVYVKSLGKFLPGAPIPNDEIDEYLGELGNGSTKLRDRVIEKSGIATRHYALDKEQQSRYSAAGMAAAAIRDALERTEIDVEALDLISAASSCPDLLAPGLASMVHGELGSGPCEIVSSQGVCCSGAMALKNAYLQILHDEKRNAVACAVEFTSRFLKSSWLNHSGDERGKRLSLDGAFLRYILSDGAGAALLGDEPGPGPGFKIEWITQRSFAGTGPPVMYCGVENPAAEMSWADYPSAHEAALSGAFMFRQDLRRLPDVVRVCADEFVRLVEAGTLEPEEIRFVAAHYSSAALKEAALREMQTRDCPQVPEERWRSNLSRVGNVGSAAIYLILGELVNSGELRDGDRVLCFVPESGRYSISYMLLSAVIPGSPDGRVASP